MTPNIDCYRVGAVQFHIALNMTPNIVDVGIAAGCAGEMCSPHFKPCACVQSMRLESTRFNNFTCLRATYAESLFSVFGKRVMRCAYRRTLASDHITSSNVQF